MKIDSSDSAVTKRVKNDYNNLTDQEFMRKYSTSKETYKKRVDKYGDPYMNAQLAKLGKKLQENQKKKDEKHINRLQKKIDSIDKDIASFDPIIGKGVTTKKGKVIMTAQDVDEIVSGLESLKGDYAEKMKKYGPSGRKQAEKILKEIGQNKNQAESIP